MFAGRSDPWVLPGAKSIYINIVATRLTNILSTLFTPGILVQNLLPIQAKIFSSIIFMMQALALTISFGIGLVEAAILLGTIFYLKPLWQQRKNLFGSATAVVGVFVFNLVAIIISGVFTGFRASSLDNPVREVTVMALIGLIALTRPKSEMFWYGLFAGTIGAAALALYQRLVFNMDRAEGFHLSIMFGDIAIAMALMSLASVPYFSKTNLSKLPYISFLAGLLASVLSGSRGGWIALVLCAIPIYTYGEEATKRRLLLLFSIGLLLFAAMCFVPQFNVLHRFTAVANDINEYRLGRVNTSIGIRLELWKYAWQMFIEHPLMGVGHSNFQAALKALAMLHPIDPAVSTLNHAHNEFLQALATKGLVGGLVLMGVYIVPLRFFMRCYRGQKDSQPYALAGILLVIAYMVFGLTQVLFAHHIGTSFYATTISALVGICLLHTMSPSRLSFSHLH